MHERRGAIARASFVAYRQQPSRPRYRSVTDTTFVSDPDAPAASRTVTVIVKLRGKTMMYVCPALNEPSLEAVPVDVEPSPQLIVYDHGPLWFASLKLKLVEYRRPVTAVWSGPALTTGALLGGAVILNAALVALVRPDALATNV